MSSKAKAMITKSTKEMKQKTIEDYIKEIEELKLRNEILMNEVEKYTKSKSEIIESLNKKFEEYCDNIIVPSKFFIYQVLNCDDEELLNKVEVFESEFYQKITDLEKETFNKIVKKCNKEDLIKLEEMLQECL